MDGNNVELEPSEEFKSLLRDASSNNKDIALEAQKTLADLFSEPLIMRVLPLNKQQLEDIKNFGENDEESRN